MKNKRYKKTLIYIFLLTKAHYLIVIYFKDVIKLNKISKVNLSKVRHLQSQMLMISQSHKKIHKCQKSVINVRNK